MAILYLRNFESGNFDGLSYQGVPRSSSHQIVTAYKRAGSYAAQMDVRISDDGRIKNFRSEFLTHDGDSTVKFAEGQERWYGWSIRLDGSAYGHDREPEIISQWHQWLNNGKPPPIALRIHNGKYCLRFRGDPGSSYAWTKPQIVDKWVDFVVNAKLTYGNSGFFKFWVNGSLVYQRSNFSILTPGELGSYFVFGIYKWRWRILNGPSDVSYRKLYLDELRMGDANSSYSEVAPGGGAEGPPDLPPDDPPGDPPPPNNPPTPNIPPPAAPTATITLQGIQTSSTLYIPTNLDYHSTPAFNTDQIINVAQEARAAMIQTRTAKPKRKVYFRVSTVTTGGLLNVRIETLLAGKPSGALVSVGASTIFTLTTGMANSMCVATLDADAIIAAYEDIAVIIENPVVNPASFVLSTLAGSGTGGLTDEVTVFPYMCSKATTVWANTLTQIIPCIALENDDGTVDELPLIWPLKTINTTTIKKTSTATPEIGMHFRFPFSFALRGLQTGGTSLANTNSDYKICLYGQGLELITELQIIRKQTGTEGIGGGTEYYLFPINDTLEEADPEEELLILPTFDVEPGILLQGNTDYYICFQPTVVGASIGPSFAYGVVENAALMASWNGGEELYRVHRADVADPFIADPLERMFMSLMINQIFENVGSVQVDEMDIEVEMFDPLSVTFEIPVIEQPAAPTLKRLFPNNWEAEEVQVETTYLTDVIESGETSCEERRGLIPKPFRTQQATLTGLSQEDSQRLLMFLAKNTESRLQVPLYSDVTELLATTGAADATISCDTRYRRFYVGKPIIIHDWRPNFGASAYFGTITSISPTQLGISPVTGAIFPGGSRVYPVLNAEKSLSSELDMITDYIGSVKLENQEIMGTLGIESSMVGFPDGEVAFNSIPIFSIPLDWNDIQQISVSREGDSFRQGKGNVIIPAGRRTKFIFGMDVTSVQRSEAWQMLNFFDSRQGRLYPLWGLSPGNLWTALAVTTTYIDIAQAAELTDLVSFIDWIVIKLKTGEFLIREVNSIIESGGNYRINLQAALPSGYSPAELEYCTSAHLLRFSEDTLTENWQTTEVCRFKFSFTELLNEKTVLVPTV